MGYLFMAQQSGNTPLYDCKAIYDHFVSPWSNCEGWTVLGVNGWIYTTSQSGTVALYRCLIVANGGTDHFVSTDPNCEGWEKESLLGYAKTQP
jgi:hypothetical protein